MKKLIQLASISAVALAAAAFMPSVTQATEPVPITFDFYFGQVDMAASVASGTFSATSALVNDQGTGVETYRLTPQNEQGGQTVHGVKTLSGDHGDIIMRMNVLFAPLATPQPVFLPDGRFGLIISQGTGRFVILSGTGAYANLHGEGSTVAKLVMILPDSNAPPAPPAFALTGGYTGQVHIDP
jgi:hypothetical protein